MDIQGYILHFQIKKMQIHFEDGWARSLIFAIRDVAKSIKQTIDESPIEATNLDYLLLHQANDRILNKMAKKLVSTEINFQPI